MDISASLHFLSLFGLQVWSFKQLIDVKIWQINVFRWHDVFWWVGIIRVDVVSPWHGNRILGAVIIGQVFLHSPFCRMACISSWGQKNDFYLNTFVDIRKILRRTVFIWIKVKNLTV